MTTPLIGSSPLAAGNLSAAKKLLQHVSLSPATQKHARLIEMLPSFEKLFYLFGMKNFAGYTAAQINDLIRAAGLEDAMEDMGTGLYLYSYMRTTAKWKVAGTRCDRRWAQYSMNNCGERVIGIAESMKNEVLRVASEKEHLFAYFMNIPSGLRIADGYDLYQYITEVMMKQSGFYEYGDLTAVLPCVDMVVKTIPETWFHNLLINNTPVVLARSGGMLKINEKGFDSAQKFESYTMGVKKSFSIDGDMFWWLAYDDGVPFQVWQVPQEYYKDPGHIQF